MIGANFKTPLDLLEKKWEEGMNIDKTKRLAISALLQVCEANSENMEVMVITKDGGEVMAGRRVRG